eukprot:365279-Chlamydomonas_euryale.AAC.1
MPELRVGTQHALHCGGGANVGGGALGAAVTLCGLRRAEDLHWMGVTCVTAAFLVGVSWVRSL